MNAKELISKISVPFRRTSKEGINIYAAGATTYFLMSILPVFVLLAALLPYSPLTSRDIYRAIDSYLPLFLHDIAYSIVNVTFQRNISLLSFSVIFILFSGGLGLYALRTGLNHIYRCAETRMYFGQRLIATFFTVMILVLIILSFVIILTNSSLVELLLHQLPDQDIDFYYYIKIASSILITIFGLFIVILIYSVVPARKNKPVDQIPGALFTTLGSVIFSYGFSLYLSAQNPANLYGALSTPILAITWLYFFFYIFFIGAYINVEYDRYRKSKQTPAQYWSADTYNLPD